MLEWHQWLGTLVPFHLKRIISYQYKGQEAAGWIIYMQIYIKGLKKKLKT